MAATASTTIVIPAACPQASFLSFAGIATTEGEFTFLTCHVAEHHGAFVIASNPSWARSRAGISEIQLPTSIIIMMLGSTQQEPVSFGFGPPRGQ